MDVPARACRSYVCAQRLTVWVLYFSGRRFVGSSENAWIPASLSLLHKITPYSQKRGVCPPKRPLFFNFMVLVESPKHPPFSMKIRTIVGSRLCGEWRYRDHGREERVLVVIRTSWQLLKFPVVASRALVRSVPFGSSVSLTNTHRTD